MGADLLEQAIALRRSLHAHPELRFEEQRTSRLIAGRMAALGLEVRSGIAGTGLIAVWSSGRPGATVVVRADMDAPPVPDLTTTGYRSEISGVSHACGHDVHMAVVCGVAGSIVAHPPEAGRVAFLFQPAEEIPFGQRSGAQAVLDSGEFDRLGADSVFGLHCWPALPAGTVGIDPAIAMAAKDAFAITVHGRGAHAASPAAGRDGILIAATLLQSLHQLIARRVDPDDSAILNVGTIEGGNSQSVLADRVRMTGTIRTVSPTIRERLRNGIEAAVAGTRVTHGIDVELEWANEMPAVRNAPALVRDALAGLIDDPGLTVVTMDRPPMTTDDFALFAERVPGLYLKLGVAASGGDAAEPLHSSLFDVDESAIGIGIDALDALVRQRLRSDRGDRT